MILYKELLSKFGFYKKDYDNIEKVGLELEKSKGIFIDDLLSFIKNNYDTPDTVISAIKGKKHILNIEKWYTALNTGKIDNSIVAFFMGLKVQNTLSYYFDDEMISSTFNFIRQWFQDKVYDIIETEWEFSEISKAYLKLIDTSMYIVSHDYMLYLSGKKDSNITKNLIIRFSEKFSFIMHTILVVLLVCMTTGSIVYFLYSLKTVFAMGMDRFFISALGSLLVVWVLIELLHSELQIIKGDKFKISIFIGVALIAFIRDLLIMTLQHNDSNKELVILLLAGVLVLGVVYFILSRIENSK